MAEFIFIEQDTLQHESEFREMVNFVFDRNKIQTILETGVFNGGTAYVWAQLAERVILIDREFKAERIYLDKPVMSKIFELTGESNSISVLNGVSEILRKENTQIDFLFIDGGHHYNSVKSDFVCYTPMVRSGGWIAFHDVFNGAWPGVMRFWEEIKQGQEYYEFNILWQPIEKKKTIWGAENSQGIGLLKWSI